MTGIAKARPVSLDFNILSADSMYLKYFNIILKENLNVFFYSLSRRVLHNVIFRYHQNVYHTGTIITLTWYTTIINIELFQNVWCQTRKI